MSEELENSDINSHSGNNHNKVHIEWDAPEFINHYKSKKWFLTAGITIILLVGYAIFTGSATMAIVFIVLAGVFFLTHNQEPQIITIKITDLGLFIGSKYYPFNMINSFWINYHPPYVHNIAIRLSDKTRTKITIQLDTQNPVEVRKELAKEIPEVEGAQESLMEILIRLLRL